jgi:hypothetical protein
VSRELMHAVEVEYGLQLQVPPKEEEEEKEDDEKTEEEKREKESDSESDSDSQAEPEQVQGDDQPVLGAIEAPAGVAPASRADKLSLGCYIFWYFRGAYLLLSGGDKYRAECGNQKVIHVSPKRARVEELLAKTQQLEELLAKIQQFPRPAREVVNAEQRRATGVRIMGVLAERAAQV